MGGHAVFVNDDNKRYCYAACAQLESQKRKVNNFILKGIWFTTTTNVYICSG